MNLRASIRRIVPWIVVGIGFVPPASLCGQTIVERLEKKLQEAIGERPAPTNDPELPAPGGPPGYLGLVIDEETADGGLQVIEVREGSPAEKAGFQVDDLITAIGGRDVRVAQDMADALTRSSSTGRIRFDVVRDGDPRQIVVTFTPNPGDLPKSKVAVAERPSLGITVAPVTDDARTKHGVPVRRGAVISAVKPGSAAVKAGLPIGSVVVAFDGRKIDTPQELIDAVRRSDVGQEVELQYYQGPDLRRKKVRLAPDFEPLAPDLDRLRPPTAPGSRIRDVLVGDLPAVKRLEGLLDRTLTPTDRSASKNLTDEIAALRLEVETLKQQVEELTKKLAELQKP